MAQCRFWNSQCSAGGRKPAAVNHLHKIKEIVEIQHRNRPCGWTLSCDFRDFWADTLPLSFPARKLKDRRSRSRCNVRKSREAEWNGVNFFNPRGSALSRQCLASHRSPQPQLTFL